VGATTATRIRAGRAELEVLVASTNVRSDATAELTDAEREVVRGVVEGKSDAAIAESRGTSARTVANQLRRVFTKLSVHSRGELRAKILGP
jgi:DNA-binding CsgD family transcriptional regulator